jgi:hypothetical protein
LTSGEIITKENALSRDKKLQTLVVTLRTIWYEVSSFNVDKIREFLNPQATIAYNF